MRIRDVLRSIFIVSLLLGNCNVLAEEVELEEPSKVFYFNSHISNPYESEDLAYVRLCLMDECSNHNISFHRFIDKYYVSESVWWYKGSEIHLGNDYVATLGAGIHAPISGYIIMEDHSITRTGWIGCDDGELLTKSGNSIYMIGEVDNKIYGFIFMHCKEIYVEAGQWVLQDSIIGTVGQTGNADCPHTHLEMFYLGEGNISEYVDKEYTIDYNVGRDYLGYSNRCSRKNTAPCILDSRDYIY